MTDIQKLSYEATLRHLREEFSDNPAPSISRVAKYFGCTRYALTKHKDFQVLTFGDKQRRITLENLALWQCRIRA